jgi:hypothetical protein
MKDDIQTDINELIITGLIVSRVRYYAEKCAFTLENCKGRFFVQWRTAAQHLERGQRIMVYGEIYSVRTGEKHCTRVRASRVTVLETQDEAHV